MGKRKNRKHKKKTKQSLDERLKNYCHNNVAKGKTNIPELLQNLKKFASEQSLQEKDAASIYNAYTDMLQAQDNALAEAEHEASIAGRAVTLDDAEAAAAKISNVEGEEEEEVRQYEADLAIATERAQLEANEKAIAEEEAQAEEEELRKKTLFGNTVEEEQHDRRVLSSLHRAGYATTQINPVVPSGVSEVAVGFPKKDIQRVRSRSIVQTTNQILFTGKSYDKKSSFAKAKKGQKSGSKTIIRQSIDGTDFDPKNRANQYGNGDLVQVPDTNFEFDEPAEGNGDNALCIRCQQCCLIS
eukprot:g4484.t1